MNTPYNLIFGISAVTFNLLVAGVFIATRHEKMQTVRKLGVIMIALGVPFSAVLIHVLNNGSNQKVSIALAAVLIYLLAELLLDFIFIMISVRGSSPTSLIFCWNTAPSSD